MSGVKGRSGGARPGAGMKKRSIAEQQQTNREIVLAQVTQEDLIAIVAVTIAGAKAGRAEDRNWLSSYVIGNAAQNLDITVSAAVKLIDEAARDALK